MSNLTILLPTYNRPDRLSELLEEFKQKNIYSEKCSLVISINGGCEISKGICDEYASDSLSNIHVYLQTSLLTYDEQMFFLFDKAKVDDYVFFVSDKYDYSKIDFDLVLQFLCENLDFYVFKDRFYEITEIKNLPFKTINKNDGWWRPGEDNYFPRVTMISSVVFKKNKNIELTSKIKDCITNFSQIYLFLDTIGEVGRFRTFPFDFHTNRGGKYFEAYWDESKGLDALIYLNNTFNAFQGEDLVFKSSLMRGMKRNGFIRYWNSAQPLNEKIYVWYTLVFNNFWNFFLPLNSFYIFFKKSFVKYIKRKLIQ
jgi:hypothetical protein